MHSVVHHKDPLCTVLDYARNFGNEAKEGLKRTSHWAAYYFTNAKSWYHVPERRRHVSVGHTCQPLPSVPMAPQRVQSMRDWAQSFVAAVRQRSVRQETTMERAGKLLFYLYHTSTRRVCLP